MRARATVAGEVLLPRQRLCSRYVNRPVAYGRSDEEELPLRVILPQLSPTAIVGAFAAAAIAASCVLIVILSRWRARRRRQYVRLAVLPYRSDDPTAEAIVNMFEALHKRLLRRWWRRL